MNSLLNHLFSSSSKSASTASQLSIGLSELASDSWSLSGEGSKTPRKWTMFLSNFEKLVQVNIHDLNFIRVYDRQ